MKGTIRWAYNDAIACKDHYSQGRVCPFPDCGEPISNTAKYCKEHGARWREWKRRVCNAAKKKRDIVERIDASLQAVQFDAEKEARAIRRELGR